MGEKSKWEMAPQLIISSVTPKTQDDIPKEEITSYLASEPNNYSPSGYPSSLPKSLPSNLPLDATCSDQQSTPSDSLSGDTSISLSRTQPQCFINPSKSLKWPFLLSLPAFIFHLKPCSSNWSHWICFSGVLLMNIPQTYLIIMNTL